jgi:tetratricopeptide (TPR) repeat protein
MYRKYLSILFAALFVCIYCVSASASSHLTKEERDIIRRDAEQEYKNINEFLKKLGKGPKEFWVKSDVEYYSKWLSGTKKELSSDYNGSIAAYKSALKTVRHEMSSYDVLLPLGRVLLLSGKHKEAIKTLTQFIKESEGDISGETNSEWSPSEDAKEAVKKEIDFAKWLLEIAKRGSRKNDR